MHYQELLEKLRQLPEEILLDLLGLTSEDLVDSFIDKIQEQEDKLHEYFDI
jgi:predicted neutral ceramidase superfamily lipid hydrolase